ncbi:MAG: mechanosensitive ion channel family protein [Conexivisphaera sp.]
MSSGPEVRRIYYFILLLAFILAVVYVVTYVVPVVPVSYSRVAAAAALAVVLYVVLRIVLLLVDRWFRATGVGPRAVLRQLISLAWFALMGIAVAAALGVDVSSVVLGSAFASVIVGLAAQTVLSNVIAGVALMVTRPLEPGQRVTLVTSQYSNVFPTYPPKYFSNDYLINGFTGRVVSVGLFYTMIEDDEGVLEEVPNSVVVQALIRRYSDSIVTTVRYWVPAGVDPDHALGRAVEAAARCGMVEGTPSAVIDEADQTGYVLVITAKCRGNSQRACRSAILRELMRELPREGGTAGR